MNHMIATFTENEPNFVLLDVHTDGMMQKKKVTVTSFLEMLKLASKDEVKGVRIGKLPKGYYDSVIHEKGFTAVITVPAGSYPLHYLRDSVVIPFPKLLFSFTVLDAVVTESLCFAVRDADISDDTPLFHYPFANVYHDGRICWGGNQLPKICSLDDVEHLVKLFYMAPSNNDLWSTEYVGNKYQSLRLMLEDLNNKDSYPVETLKPIYKSVSSLLRTN